MDAKQIDREQTLLSMLFEKNAVIRALIAENKRLRDENNTLKKGAENVGDVATQSAD